MKYLFLFILSLFLFQACSDNESSTSNNECNADSDCEIYQLCNSSKKCELKEGMCGNNDDCTDDVKTTCSLEYQCIEVVELEDCTVDGDECLANTNGKTVCVDSKCSEPIEVTVCTDGGDECLANTNGKTVCIDDKCELSPNLEDCTVDGNECVDNTNGKTLCVDSKCSEPIEVTVCTDAGDECLANTNGKTLCVDTKCLEPIEVTDCTEDANCADNTNGATVCDNGKCVVDGCTPTEEICDGLDNDCDGFIDEDLVAENAEKQDGVCAGTKLVCAFDTNDGVVKWLEPDYTQIDTYQETETSCDDLDNDCDNAVDEGCGGCTVGDKKDCGTDVGSCEKGQQTCSTEGIWGDCIGGTTPIDEVCDGKDNDCNGEIDDALVAENAEKQDGVCAGSKLVCALDTNDSVVKWLEPDYTQIDTYQETETTCDGLDNDCNGEVDEGLVTIYYRDGDGDTFGKPSDTIEACLAPYGYVERNSDCNDVNPDVNPGVAELCDGIDNNCDGNTDEGFANTDGDALPDCMDTDDDNDGDPDTSDCAPLDSSINRDAAEICDTVDNNCDKSIDEGCSCVDDNTQECGSSDVGECVKGVQTCSGGEWGTCEGVVEATEEICDGLDNNCDGAIDEGFDDTDNDSKADCVDPDDDNDSITDENDNCQFIANTDQANNDGDNDGDACDTDDDNDGDPDTSDCAPLDSSINHGATETCDTIDNNCDGVTDEGCDCTDGTTQACGSDIGECVKGTQTCSGGTWGDCDGEVVPSPEVCDGLDNDCDTLTDIDDDTLEASPLSTNQNGICVGSKQVCAGGSGWIDPVFSDLADYEADDSSCNGIDNNCNATNDEGYDKTATVTSCGVGECASTGHLICTDGEEISDCVAGDPIDEICDGLDNNCNGEADDAGLLGIAPNADMQNGVCLGSKKVCAGVDGWIEPNYSDYSVNYQSEETSCDDLDNDCDAFVDENPIELCTDNSIANPKIMACIKDTDQSSCKQILANVSYLSLGFGHSCAFNPDSGTDGEAYCWGDNEYGQLGNANETSSYVPKKVDDSLDADNIMESDSGALFNCSLTLDENVKCWGRNASGQLGDNSNDDSSVPVLVQKGGGLGGVYNLKNIESISTGATHACGVFDDGDNNYVYCWGNNKYGQLGDNSDTNRNTAVLVKDGTGYSDKLEDVVKVVAGVAHTCALMENDKVYCWGDNSKGQLGDDRAEDHSEIAIQVPNLDNVFDIVAGSNFTCVNYLDNNGDFDVKCWGDNSSKQILDTNYELYDTPQSVALDNVDGFVANGANICYVLDTPVDTPVVYCKGDNSQNQLGVTTPSNISETKGYHIVNGDLGAQHLCVIINSEDKDYRAIMCRGLNKAGQLGLGYKSTDAGLSDFHFVLAGDQPDPNE